MGSVLSQGSLEEGGPRAWEKQLWERKLRVSKAIAGFKDGRVPQTRKYKSPLPPFFNYNFHCVVLAWRFFLLGRGYAFLAGRQHRWYQEITQCLPVPHREHKFSSLSQGVTQFLLCIITGFCSLAINKLPVSHQNFPLELATIDDPWLKSSSLRWLGNDGTAQLQQSLHICPQASALYFKSESPPNSSFTNLPLINVGLWILFFFPSGL